MDKINIYSHKGKIKNWHEGLMLGNGSFGALIYGDDNLICSLDKIDLWDNRKTSEMKEKGFNYKNMIKTLKNNWDEYLRLFNNCYEHPYPTKLNAGSLIFHKEISNKDKFKIDIKKAEFDILVDNNNFHGYLDANYAVLRIICPENIPFSFNVPEYLSKKENDNGLDYPLFKEYKENEYRYIIQETKCGFSFSIIVYETLIDQKRNLFVTVFKSEDIFSELKRQKEFLKTYSVKVNNYLIDHRLYWRKFYATSSVSTGEKIIDRLYMFSQYFFACNSKGKYPMALEGVWTRNDGNLPPWKGDYHLDINLQMSYESYMKTGNFFEGRVLVDYLWNNLGTFKELAKSFCHSRGIFIPGVMSQNCTPLGGWPMYSINPCQGIWVASTFDNYYRYTGNKSFLKKRAYPFFKQLELCIKSLLIEDENGYIKFEFSASPEINDCTKEALFESQTNFEKGMLHYLYRILVEYSKIIGKNTSYYEEMLKKVAPYSINQDCEFMISDDMPYNVSHRHFSHILSHKNLENLNPYDHYDQIKRDFDCLEKYGHKQWVAFSFTEASQLASYICLGEQARDLAFAFADGFVNDNGFNMNMDFKHKGYSEIYSYAFTLEANMGFIKAIDDMMLRTTGGIITIFPAIPESYKKNGVSFKNLRGYNNIKVSGSYKNNELSFLIKSKKPTDVKLYNNIGEKLTLMVDDKPVSYNSKIGEIIEIRGAKVISL